MGINITIELTQTNGLSPEAIRKAEADLANSLDETIQSYWARCAPHVTIDYFDDAPVPGLRLEESCINVRCHFNGSHVSSFTDQKVYRAVPSSEGLYWSVVDDLGVSRVIALDSPCPHLWAQVPIAGHKVSRAPVGYWTREPEAT
jgi:predicted CxxxxCH...CXXCH cytochrome family protein